VGYIRVKGIVANPLRRDVRVEVEFIADTGAIYTVIPRSIAEKLGLEITDRRRFKILLNTVVAPEVSLSYRAQEQKPCSQRQMLADIACSSALLPYSNVLL